jgi:exodeoxyribonuclease V alpha subunit
LSIHVSVRLAWHDSGWNGRVCQKPKHNVYCVGPHSFPGDIIANRRILEWEEKHKGDLCRSKYNIPPCCYSTNAFGQQAIWAESYPPDFFRDDTKVKKWKMPPATVCTWPYEEIYSDEARKGEYYSAEKRKQLMSEYFSKIENDKSLIFYYANYSNPFSEDEAKKYVLVGVSRVREVKDELTWENQSKESRQKYGEHVWARMIQSNYPEQGMRIPYHRYMGNEEILSRIVVIPDNPRNFKYGTRHISDDDALDLIERLIEVAGTLKEIGDKTENWDERLRWLNSIGVNEYLEDVSKVNEHYVKGYEAQMCWGI